MMLCLYSGLLFAYITSLVLVSAQPNKTQICLKSRNKAVYTCEANQMIHVISRLYQEASEDCEVPDDACEVKQDTLSNDFVTDCSGKVKCTEDLSLFNINKTCGNITAAIATISYECISGPPVSVCSAIAPSLGTHTLYLASPNFPGESGITDSACECNITGSNMSVEILEIKFLFDPSVRANLTLTGDISSWQSYPSSFLMYNQKVISTAGILHVTFNAYNRKSQRMWLRIVGTSNIMTQCNYLAPSTTSPAPPSSISSHPTSVTKTNGTPNKSGSTSISPGDTRTEGLGRTKPAESNTVAVAVGCVFAVLVVAAIIIVVVFIMMRRKRLKPYLASQDDEGSMKHIEAYQMSLASRESLDNKVSNNGYGPPSPDYADVEPLSSRKPDTGDTKVLNNKSSRVSGGPESPDYAEISPLQTTETGNRDRQPTPHYFVLEKVGSPKTDVGQGSSPSGASSRPAGSEYAEPYTMDISKPYDEQKNSPEKGPGDPSTPNKSSVPYTTKRLEELYAKVVPKKFRSTRDMREAEKKTNTKDTKMKRKSDTSEKGITNNAYDDGDEKIVVKHESRTKEKKSRSKGNPDYRETGNVSVPQHDSDVSPPVPPKLDGILNELGTTKEPGNQEPDLSSKNKKSNKNRKERSSASDTIKTSEADMKEGTQSKSETDAGSKSMCGSGKDGTGSEDKLVMVDNVLYEGTDGHVQSRTGTNSKLPSGSGRGTNTSADDPDDKLVVVPNVLYEATGANSNTRNGVLDSSHGKSSHQVLKGSEYEDVKDDHRSSRPLVISGTRTDGSSPYEEVVV